MRLAARAGAGIMGVAVLIALVVGAWNAITPDRQTPGILLNESAGTPTTASATKTGNGPATSPVQPSIPEGRRDLGDSIYAIRDGVHVTVFFDTDSLRTRFDWKFEGVVRATLPLVFGDDVGDALSAIPAGTLAGGGDLLRDLPARGIPIKLRDHTLRVWPITRQGRDGPLVVAYRAAPALR